MAVTTTFFHIFYKSQDHIQTIGLDQGQPGGNGVQTESDVDLNENQKGGNTEQRFLDRFGMLIRRRKKTKQKSLKHYFVI